MSNEIIIRIDGEPSKCCSDWSRHRPTNKLSMGLRWIINRWKVVIVVMKYKIHEKMFYCLKSCIVGTTVILHNSNTYFSNFCSSNGYYSRELQLLLYVILLLCCLTTVLLFCLLFYRFLNHENLLTYQLYSWSYLSLFCSHSLIFF